jgi:phytoene/squalene synthetase
MQQPAIVPPNSVRDQGVASDEALPAIITRTASKQTYYTIHLLVDRAQTHDAYRAYAYFRWVDDWLDERVSDRSERQAFIDRQQALMDACYHGVWPHALTVEEQMLVDLIRGDSGHSSGLQSYVRHMMAVLVFDAERRGRLISGIELAGYTRDLSTAVTDALQYFIGHGQFTPQSESRCLAATGAHIAHLLRDTFEDVAAGYYNIPAEFLEAHGIGPRDVESTPYRTWVKSRVQLARASFKAGEGYLAQLKNLRCRLAGYAYIARFMPVLDAIERDEYRLRPAYPECTSLRAGLKASWSLLADAVGFMASSWTASA